MKALLEEKLVAFLTKMILLGDRIMAVPRVRPAVEALVFLITTSGAFWFMSRALSFFALKIYSILDHSLGVLFAVGYNALLAVMFSGVMALAIFKKTKGTDDVLAYQAAGFVFVYLALSAAYSDAQGVVDEYSSVGYVAGLLAYLGFCVHTSWLGAKWLDWAYDGLAWARSPGPQRWILAAGVANGLLFAARSVRRRLFFKSVNVGGKRRFVF